ncbi:unnamed protein product [Parajaminaea phylloscopi]
MLRRCLNCQMMPKGLSRDPGVPDPSSLHEAGTRHVAGRDLPLQSTLLNLCFPRNPFRIAVKNVCSV